jgi:hypothetical protein
VNTWLIQQHPAMSYQRELLQRVTINPEVMAEKPTIRRMRIAIKQILRALTRDDSHGLVNSGSRAACDAILNSFVLANTVGCLAERFFVLQSQ